MVWEIRSCKKENLLSDISMVVDANAKSMDAVVFKNGRKDLFAEEGEREKWLTSCVWSPNYHRDGKLQEESC